jgi:hypothetical protein
VGLSLAAVPASAQAAEITPAARVAAAPAAGKGHDFGKLSAATYLSCTKEAEVSGTFGLKVSGLTTSFKNYTKSDEQKKFKAAISWSTTISASLDASDSTTCTPSKTALKKLAVPFTINGVKITITPDFEFKLGAEGDISASQTTTQSLTVSGKLGLAVPAVSHSVTAGKPKVSADGSGTFDALIGASADIAAGVAHLDLGLMAGVHASAKVKSDPAEVCLSGYPELEGTGKVVVKLLAWEKDKTFLDDTWAIKSVGGHSTTFSECTANDDDE